MNETKPTDVLLCELLQNEIQRLCLSRQHQSAFNRVDVRFDKEGILEIFSVEFSTKVFSAMHTLSNWRNLPFGSTKEEVLAKVVDENWSVIHEKNTRFFDEDKS